MPISCSCFLECYSKKYFLFSDVPADKVLFLLKSLNRQICFDGRTKEEHVIQLIKMYPNCLHADRDYFTGRQQTVRFPAPELDVSVAAVVVRNTGDLLLPERQPDTFHHGNYTPEKECYELSPPVTPELARKVQDLERQQALFVTRKVYVTWCFSSICCFFSYDCFVNFHLGL